MVNNLRLLTKQHLTVFLLTRFHLKLTQKQSCASIQMIDLQQRFLENWYYSNPTIFSDR
ncbi:hypothetical protein ACWATR_04350 [Nostoc sp. UIC 10890]